MQLRFKTFIVILATLSAVPFATWAQERQYLVAGRKNALPDPVMISAAGGLWTGQIASIGVAIVKSSNPDFLTRVKEVPSVQLAAPDVELQLPESELALEESEMLATGEQLSPPLAGQTLAAGATSNDPFSILEWDNMLIGAKAAHDRGITGEGVTIAVVDSGIDKTHPDLINSVVASGISFLPSDPNPFPTTGNVLTQGHGTAMVGIIAATCDNGIGVCGVAPGAKLLSVRISDGVSNFPVSRILKAYDWASSQGVSTYGVKIINASHGVFCRDTDSSCRDNITDLMGIANRMIAEVYKRGVVLFASAGNQGVDVSQDDSLKHWPAGSKAETIGATGPCCVACDGNPLNDHYDLLAVYSNFGFSQMETNYFVMPAGQRLDGCSYPTPNLCQVLTPLGIPPRPCQLFDMVWTTSLQSTVALLGRYIPFSGTSASAAQASGLAALILSRYPDFKVGQLTDAIHGNGGIDLTEDIGDPGYDPLFGYGRGNAALIP